MGKVGDTNGIMRVIGGFGVSCTSGWLGSYTHDSSLGLLDTAVGPRTS